MRHRDIVLDFGSHQMFLSGSYYNYKISGNYVLIECSKGTGKKWVYRFSGLGASDREIRFYVKEEEPPKMRLLPKIAHANYNNN